MAADVASSCEASAPFCPVCFLHNTYHLPPSGHITICSFVQILRRLSSDACISSAWRLLPTATSKILSNPTHLPTYPPLLRSTKYLNMATPVGHAYMPRHSPYIHGFFSSRLSKIFPKHLTTT